MHFLYIIYSEKADRYYIGECVNVEERLEEHRNHKYVGAYTTRAKDWILKLSVECRDRIHARKLEDYLKKKKSRRYLEYFMESCEIQKKVIEMF